MAERGVRKWEIRGWMWMRCVQIDRCKICLS